MTRESEAICPMAQSVLIVDDEKDLADTCARLLRRAGFECLVAYGFEEALSLFDSNRPALVLSDLTLPTGNGFEVARHVRKSAPDTRIVLMTAYHSANAEQEAVLAGADGYLRKPFQNAELIATIKSLIVPDGHA